MSTEPFETLPDGSLVLPSVKSLRYGRNRSSEPAEPADRRTETERDRGRISYSPFLRRLAGVTQVTSPELSTTRLHSRASHSHKVATIAREIGENLVRRAATEPEVEQTIRAAGGLDVSACESAGLAHDLGHPPFGHAGEKQLDFELQRVASRHSLSDLDEGFEGNAQSFRIVTRLDRHHLGVQGLDLTNVTLAAIQKYPYGRRKDSDKFGAYASEITLLERCRRAITGDLSTDRQSLEAAIMDIADDIAYAVHDLEDFCGTGVIDLRGPLADLESARKNYDAVGSFIGDPDNPFAAAAIDLDANPSAHFDARSFRDAIDWTFDFIHDDLPDFIGVPGPESLILLREQLSPVVALLFGAIRMSLNNGPTVYLETAAWHRLQCLKTITRRYLVTTPQMGLIQRAQRQVISGLFRGLESWLAQCPDDGTIPPELKDYIELAGEKVPRKGTDGKLKSMSAPHFRAISDYICGMSDAEALRRSQWVSGSEVPGMSSLGLVV